MSNLKNKVAVVTGASSGIGKAIAVGLADKGAKLCLVGRNIGNLENISKTADVTSYKADLTLDENIYMLKDRLQQDFGYIDILVHSAGVISLGMMEHANIKDFDWQFRINVHAPYLLTQVLLPMIKPHRGQIVFINSSAGLKADANVGQYSATKHALRAIADSLREEVNEDSVRVISVFPGRTATPMQAAVCKIEGKTYQPERFMQPEDVAAVVINALVLQRTAEVTNINIRPLIKSG